MRTVQDAIAHTLVEWEGGFQNMPSDSGNWVTMPDGSRELIGTMRGITPAALASYLDVPVHTITVDDIKNVTPWLAAKILMDDYYTGPGYGKLPWCALIENVVDFGINAGPGTATRRLQIMVGTTPDGAIGPLTIDAVWDYLLNSTMADAVNKYTDMRRSYYIGISSPGTKNHKFRRGWLRRAEWYRPENPAFWNQWRKAPSAAAMYAKLSNEELGSEPETEVNVVEEATNETDFWDRIMDWIERMT
jgi:lysozyme family protein